MQKGKKFTFFCPKKLMVDVAIQKDDSRSNRLHPPDIYTSIHKASEESVLLQSSDQLGSIDNAFITDIRSKLGYILYNLKDDKFDSLTPPEEQYEKLKASIFYELYPDNFFVINVDTNMSTEFKYIFNDTALLEPLETGHMTEQLLEAIDVLNINVSYENGCCLCDVTDFRFEPHIHKKMKLKIPPEIIPSFLKFVDVDINRCKNKQRDGLQNGNKFYSYINEKSQNKQKIETEKNLILKMHPTICIDPSPNVARANSIYDFRAKMWRNNKLQDFENNSKNQSNARPITMTTNEFVPVVLKTNLVQRNIAIPMKILNVFTAKESKEAQ